MNAKIINPNLNSSGKKYNIPKGISNPVSSKTISDLPCAIAISNIKANTNIKNNVIMLMC